MDAFYNINDKDQIKMLNCMDSTNSSFKKGFTIMSNVSNAGTLCIVTKGKADLIRIDYNGDKSVIVTLNEGDVFESSMVTNSSGELSIVALEDTEVIMIDYDKVINRCKKNCPYHNQFIDNILQLIMTKLNKNYERILLLTKKTIREKLLEYFRSESYKNNSKSFKLDMSLSSLASYLSVDRTALMRELKNLKDDRIIELENKKVKILEY